MKKFSCGDVVPGCTAVFHEPDTRSVLAAVTRHARIDHGMLDVSPELAAQVTAAIRTVDGLA